MLLYIVTLFLISPATPRLCRRVSKGVAGRQGTFVLQDAGTVAGEVAALIRAAHPNMPVGAVQALLQNTAMPKDCPTPAEMDPLSGALGVQTCTGGPGHARWPRSPCNLRSSPLIATAPQA